MIDGIRLKVCGLKTLVDADAADACGADYLGFNLHPQSPRHISLAQFNAMAPRLPSRKNVAIMVAPTVLELAAAASAGFDVFQIHFPLETPIHVVGSWAETVGVSRLWLAPKLPPAEEVPPALLEYAVGILFDTYHPEGFGGSGKTGDWSKFARHQARYPEKAWILAGGLSPENIDTALMQSGARFIDVNSGVESAPGVKDHAKLRQLATRLRERRN